jgi:predicted aldo/keto reductase-like oxidoreductase
MHHLTDVLQWERLKQLGIKEWIKDKKENGQIGNIGFSYHGNTDMFIKILEDYDWDFAQIQYNYLDENTQAGRKGLERAEELGIPIVIMEPLRGGKLVNMLPEKAKEMIKENKRNYSAAEWGLR